MKTVKITLIAMVLLLANSTKAQTLEETEQWLNEYGKKITLSYTAEYPNKNKKEKSSLRYIGFDGEFLNFAISRIFSDGGSYKSNLKVLPKDILYQDLSTFSEDDFIPGPVRLNHYYLNAKSGTVFRSGIATNGVDIYGRKVTYTFGDNDKSEIEEKIETIHFVFAENEATEALRLLKAIYHFAKLKGASDLPKVKKDTF